ncbi:hypothetical protein AVEN_71299-1 [Araneus ventricosus]|uniref:Uncharacterized protein n=1 Tax=Araneus ventricosus TaxID=182803 RepID=A0A4Y2K5F6_ARAVE|nr:hypothetical protein AVEN_71299-1 [Araneus ventricosus]
MSASDFESDEENISSSGIEEITEKEGRPDNQSSNNGREIDTIFRWQDYAFFEPEIYNFHSRNLRVSELCIVADDAENYEYLTRCFDRDLVHVIVNETSICYEYCAID